MSIWQRVTVLRHVAHALRRRSRSHREPVVTVVDVRPDKRVRRFTVGSRVERP